MAVNVKANEKSERCAKAYPFPNATELSQGWKRTEVGIRLTVFQKMSFIQELYFQQASLNSPLALLN